MTRRREFPQVKAAPNVPELSVESAVRDNLDGVAESSPVHASLVATALTLARKLDEGAGLATAAVARELRATLDVLTKGAADDDDDGFAALVAGLSTAVGDNPYR